MYGLVLLGKDNREILVLTAYNIPHKAPAGDDTQHAQPTSMYLYDNIDNPNLRKLSIRDLVVIIEDALQIDQKIILMCDFNETNREYQKKW